MAGRVEQRQEGWKNTEAEEHEGTGGKELWREECRDFPVKVYFVVLQL